MLYLTIFLRGFLIVTCTAANVVFVSQHRWAWAFATGYAISFLWWSNAFTAAHRSLRFSGAVYALGAAVGTLTGMALAGLVM